MGARLRRNEVLIMRKRPDTMETVHLALELLRRIPPRTAITAEALHAQLVAAGLKRDLRTIQRQLKMLCQHFDIECLDQDKPYGYRWKEKAKGFSLPSLGPRESLLLALAEQQLRPLLPANLVKSMESFFGQARRNLGPTSSAVLERQWLKKVRVVNTTQPLLPPKIAPGVFEAVSDALYGNLWLKVDYANAAGGRIRANVMPLGLAQQGARLYLVCRFEGFTNNRILAIHRIRKADAGTIMIDRPKDFDLEKYADDGTFGFGDGKRIKLSFTISKQAGFHLLETPLSTDQTVTEQQDGYAITATVVESLVLDHWLRGFGGEIRNVTREAQ
jgi:predicted DNA-binding transcriptional regulator YafY